MIEVNNKLYIQRLLATKLQPSDLFKAVTYTQYLGDPNKIPFLYRKVYGETATIDLTRPIEEVFSNMKSNTRNEAKRAIKEGCRFEYNTDFASFVPFYNDFCESKGLPEKISEQTLSKYDGMLITIAKHGDTVLAMHATVVNKRDNEAMLFYSCSQRLSDDVDRKLIGWGNRYLHYKEFELFKDWGIERYEWNGVNTNQENVAQYNISLFKLGFGCEAKESLSLRTPLFVFMKNIQNIISKLRK